MAAVDAGQLPSALLHQSAPARDLKPASHRDLDHLIGFRSLRLFHGEPALDRFANVPAQFLHRLALRNTPRQRRNLRPKTTFVRLYESAP